MKLFYLKAPFPFSKFVIVILGTCKVHPQSTGRGSTTTHNNERIQIVFLMPEFGSLDSLRVVSI